MIVTKLNILVEAHLDVLDVDGSSRMLQVAAIETSPGTQCSFGERTPEISLGLGPRQATIWR